MSESESPERTAGRTLKERLDAEEREEIPMDVSLKRTEVSYIVSELTSVARRLERESIDAGYDLDYRSDEQIYVAKLLDKLWAFLK